MNYCVFQARPFSFQPGGLVVQTFMMPGSYSELDGSRHGVMGQPGPQTFGIPSRALAPFHGSIAPLREPCAYGVAGHRPRTDYLLAVRTPTILCVTRVNRGC